jgi:hypothetical protein
MMTWLTTTEAATFLSARGVTVVSRQGRQPPTPQTIKVWCQRGVLAQTQRIGGRQRGYYLIAQDELERFEPPAMGRPLIHDPSPATLAKRRSRGRSHPPFPTTFNHSQKAGHADADTSAPAVPEI